MITWILLGSLTGLVLIAFKIISVVNRRPTSLRLPGPTPLSWLWGQECLLQLNKDFRNGTLIESWMTTFGRIFELPTIWGGRKLVICDLKAINRILSTNAYNYERTPEFRTSMHLLVSILLLGDFALVTLTFSRFIKQYSPSCPHCTKIAPAWQTLYEFYYVR